MIAYAEWDKFSAVVNWTEPVATDNSRLSPKVTTNYHSPQRFGEGAHVIVYNAMDQSGNKATCTFTVVVTGITNYRVGMTYIIPFSLPRASFPDVSLSMKTCVQRKAARRKRAMRFVTSHLLFALTSVRKTEHLRRMQPCRSLRKTPEPFYSSWRQYLRILACCIIFFQLSIALHLR